MKSAEREGKDADSLGKKKRRTGKLGGVPYEEDGGIVPNLRFVPSNMRNATSDQIYAPSPCKHASG
jgi:hypothetical protein